MGALEFTVLGAVVSLSHAATATTIASSALDREAASRRESLNVYVIEAALSRLLPWVPNRSRSSPTTLGLDPYLGQIFGNFNDDNLNDDLNGHFNAGC
jgi:hypothetical protein